MNESKLYSFRLNFEDDEDLIKTLDSQQKRSQYIRKALRAYTGVGINDQLLDGLLRLIDRLQAQGMAPSEVSQAAGLSPELLADLRAQVRISE